jgi:hypothetical protein
MAALAGKAGAKELTRPIRDGESTARVVVELDDLRVERKWTKSGSTLTVGPKNGTAKLNSPQAVLDRLIGALAFDPLAFAQADDKAQVERLIDIVGREKFDALAEERKAAYENRTDINREIRRLRAEIESDSDAKHVEPVDMVALVEEARGARERQRLEQRWEYLTSEINRLAIERAEIEKEGLRLPKTRPLEEIETALGEADHTNREAQRWVDLQAASEALARAEEVSAKHTALIESVDEQKAKLIAEASLPIDGLGFDEDGVIYNGVPFRQASAAERLKVSVAMAMAMNPDLRVICIRDASLLDDDSKIALVEMAKAHDYQIWYEVVGNPGEMGVVLEDGEVQ